MDSMKDIYSPEDRDACLASMFTSIVSALDVPSRELLSETVQYCHTRLHGSDCRDTPVIFFSERDSVRQAIARPHLSQIAHLTENPQLPNNPQLSNTPLNDCEQLQEQFLYHKLDDEAKQEYLSIRNNTSRADCLQVGYRYLLHLAHPQLPLEFTLRPTPVAADIEIDDDRLSEDDEDEDVYSEEESWYTDISDVTRESDVPSSDPDLCEGEAG